MKQGQEFGQGCDKLKPSATNRSSAMSRQLTQQYIAAFSAKNLAAVAELLHDNVALEDPVVKRIEGKSGVLAAMQGIFDGAAHLSFSAKNIYEDGATNLIEFRLELDKTVLTGVDIIEWDHGKMRELRAYLDIPKG